MAEDDSKLIARFTELAERAARTSVYTETKFLNMAEQSVLLRLRLPAPVSLWGGFPEAERRIAYFGSEEQMGYAYDPPVRCIAICPANDRFSDELTHRDFLGAALGLGLTRDVLGDIVVRENRGYLFCLETVSGFIADELTEVKRTSVRCSQCEPGELRPAEPVISSLVVASERLDAMIAAVWKLPREEAKRLCEKGLVFVDAKLALKGGAQIGEGSTVSVRGRGRFVFYGVGRETKKGKLRIDVGVF